MTLSRRMRWLSAVVIVGWLAFKAVPAAWHAVRESRWQLADRVRLLERSRAELAQTATLEDSAQTLRARLLELAPHLVTGTTAAEAADGLAGLANVMVERVNGRVTSVQGVADSTAAGLLRRIGVSVALETDVRGLDQLLRLVTSEDPVLTLERLNVLVVDPSAPVEAPELLRVELVLRGWYQPERAS